MLKLHRTIKIVVIVLLLIVKANEKIICQDIGDTYEEIDYFLIKSAKPNNIPIGYGTDKYGNVDLKWIEVGDNQEGKIFSFDKENKCIGKIVHSRNAEGYRKIHQLSMKMYDKGKFVSIMMSGEPGKEVYSGSLHSHDDKYHLFDFFENGDARYTEGTLFYFQLSGLIPTVESH